MSIPEDVQTLLLERVESHEQLQMLLWLRDHRERAWSADTVTKVLGIPLLIAREGLRALARQGLLSVPTAEPPPLYQYGPVDADLARSVERLALSQADQPVEVMRLMIRQSMDRLRRGASTLFLDERARRKR